VIDKLSAVLTDYYGGPHQAIALADAIFGVTNPGGKLPFTMPRHVGQVPIHYGQKWGSGYRRTIGHVQHSGVSSLSCVTCAEPCPRRQPIVSSRRSVWRCFRCPSRYLDIK
jgi:ribosomal protein L37AE/L43A